MRTPSGVGVLRDSPHDHVHHHGLMFAVKADGVNFWEERAESGHQVQTAFEAGADELRQRLDWVDAAGVALLRESRSIRLDKVEGCTRITWTSTLRPGREAEPVELTGSHYHGLGARFAVSLDGAATFLLPPGTAGEAVRGTERLTPVPWAAVSGEVEGKPVTFALFSAPANPVHPPPLFTMTAPFAYLSATLNLWKKPLVIPPGGSVTLTYGVALWDGRRTAEDVAQAYTNWASGTKQP